MEEVSIVQWSAYAMKHMREGEGVEDGGGGGWLGQWKRLFM